MLNIDLTQCSNSLSRMKCQQSGAELASPTLRKDAHVFKRYITDLLNTVFKTQAPMFQKVSGNDYHNLLKDKSYGHIREIHIYIPPGMIKTYPEYVKTLNSITKEFLPIFEKNLRNYELTLAKYLTDPTHLTKLDELNVNNPKLDDAIKKLAKVYDASKTEERAPYGKLINRNKDWKEVVTLSTSNAAEFDRYPIEDMEKRIREVSATANHLTEYIVNGDYEVNAATVNSLSEASYDMARQIEFYALLYTQQAKLSVALSDNVKRLKECL